METTSEYRIAAPREIVWGALRDAGSETTLGYRVHITTCGKAARPHCRMIALSATKSAMEFFESLHDRLNPEGSQHAT